MVTEKTQKYLPVAVETLTEGMLVDRPLYLYLASNDRYIPVCKTLHPLEQRVFAKIKKLGGAFSPEAPIEVRFPQLTDSARSVRELCDDLSVAPFEKNVAIRGMTQWLVQHVLQSEQLSLAPLVFFHRAFGVPKAETLLFVSDLSLVMYERSLRLTVLSGLLALWLGYSDTRFLQQFAETVFCEEVGAYCERIPLTENTRLSDSERVKSLELIKAGHVPGVNTSDERFRSLMNFRTRLAESGDELSEVIEFARAHFMVKDSEKAGVEKAKSSRVARKLGWWFANFQSLPAAALPTREAA